jgi:hypothetical protein
MFFKLGAVYNPDLASLRPFIVHKPLWNYPECGLNDFRKLLTTIRGDNRKAKLRMIYVAPAEFKRTETAATPKGNFIYVL